MAEQQITGFPVRAAPNSRTTKDSENFELLAVNATFDGSAASVAFLPAVEVVSDSGAVVGRHVTGETVAAGGSAEVTFAPFLRGQDALAAVRNIPDQRAYVRFIGSELAADATKVLVPAVAGTIVIPLDWYIVASTDYSPSGGTPDLSLQTPTHGYDTHSVDSFGVTFYNNASGYFLAPGVDSIPLTVTGEQLQVTAVSNGATSAVGHIEVFVRYYTVVPSP